MVDFNALLSILLALGLGGLLGLEREISGKAAGLRTNMLVAGASAFLVQLADLVVESFLSESPSVVRVDSIRVIEAVVTGVSFIGAGAIIRRRVEPEPEVEGLTTAATLLFSASVGMACALDAGWLAVYVTVAVLVTLRVVGIVERRLEPSSADSDSDDSDSRDG